MASLVGLGEAALRLGEYQEARRYFAEALKMVIDSHQLYAACAALTGMAELLICDGKPEQTVHLLALVLHHRATSYQTRERAQALLATFKSQLSPQAYMAAIE